MIYFNFFNDWLLEKESSAIPYFGSKYSLIDDLKKYFPKNINTFNDLFTGAGNVIINAEANNRIANDINDHLINLYNFIKNTPEKNLDKLVINTVLKYKLDKNNKEQFFILQDEYNKKRDPIMFYVLVMTGFRNIIKLDKSEKFRNAYSQKPFNIKNRILSLNKFKKNIQGITFYNLPYNKVIKTFNSNDFAYVDPPYLISQASYNRFWTESSEKELYEYLDFLDSKGVKFMLSNVTDHGGRLNDILIEWSKKYKTVSLNKKYNLNLRKEEIRNLNTNEVIVMNYEN